MRDIRAVCPSYEGTCQRDFRHLKGVGRVELPRELIRRLAMRNRVEWQEEPDHIGVWPDQATDQDRR